MSQLYTVVLPEVPAAERIVAAARRVGIAVGDGSATAGLALVRDPGGGPSVEVSYGPLDDASARLHTGAAWGVRVRVGDPHGTWGDWQQAKLVLLFLDVLDGRLSVPGEDVRTVMATLRMRAARPPTGMVDVRLGDSGSLRQLMVGESGPAGAVARLRRLKVVAAFVAAAALVAVAALLLVKGGRAAGRAAAVCAGFALLLAGLGLYWARRRGGTREREGVSVDIDSAGPRRD